jgi:uncharacterized protein
LGYPACYNLENPTNFTGIIVNSNRRPFRINIGFLINQPVGTLREIPVEVESYSLEKEFPVENLHGVISLARTYNGIRSITEVYAKTDSECGRCLEPFKQELHTEFEEIFTFENKPLSEDEVIIPEDGNIDFEALIREYLVLEMPYKPVCRPDCKGLCMVCGQNLNEKDCGHPHPVYKVNHSKLNLNSKELSKN